MLPTIIAIIGALSGVFVLSQAFLRWRAHGTEPVRRLATEMRSTLREVIDNGELSSNQFQREDRLSLESRLLDVRGQLRDHVLQDRIDDLLSQWRVVLTEAPPQWIGVAVVDWRDGVSGRFTTDDDERREQVRRQCEAASNGIIEMDGVLERCNQLTHWVVFG